MEYQIGQKVVITNKNPVAYKQFVYGHTCIIRKVIKGSFYDHYHQTYGDIYRLEWRQEDNPDKECKYKIGIYNWVEDDFIPYLPIPRAIISGELPDV